MTMTLDLQQHHDYYVGRFDAMACTCEILMDTRDSALAQQLCRTAQQETLRIEQKYSRYRDDNIIHAINNANGAPVDVDNETADLLDYAQQCYQL
ncbi:MAG: FAD:protein FMN transferase, partial [Gammaproteobacteria bacterium]